MEHPMYPLLAQIDALWEQPPTVAFDTLLATSVGQPREQQPPEVIAATRILQGLWLSYLGTWCPDDWERVSWNGLTFTATEDDPLGYQLMMAGVTLRTAGCRLASYGVPVERLATLHTLLVAELSPRLREWGEVVHQWVEVLATQSQTQLDWFGCPLPAPIETLSALFYASEPARRQGDTSIVTPIALGRQQYLVKRLIEPGPLLTLYEGLYRECATTALLQALPRKVGPHTGCLFVSTDGTLSYLTGKVPGVLMTDLRKAASRISLASVQAAVLAEFVGNLKDRHAANIFIDRLYAQPWLIDFAPALDADIAPIILPAVTLPLEAQRQDFTRALWVWHPDCLQTSTGAIIILDEVLDEFVAAQAAALQTLIPYALPAELYEAIERRFTLLARLRQQPGEKTLEDLNRLIVA